MKAERRTQLTERIKTLQGLTDDERGDLLELLRTNKTYGLVWENHREDVEERLRDELPVLVEDETKRLTDGGKDAPNHVLIEGDNLEALTALAYTHAGKIDVIYVDPPYNTGNKDFIYNDSFVDSEDDYRHSKWLSFMNKRLRIAKKLLSDRGVIFISIDDNEQANLKLLCDDIFGEKNFIGQLILKTATDNNPSQINIEHEYMLCYAKNKSLQKKWKRTSQAARLIIDKYAELKKTDSSLEQIQFELRKWIKINKKDLPQVSHYNNVDGKGVYSSSSNSSNPHPGGYLYDIIHPITHQPCPKPSNGWRWPFSTFNEYDQNGDIEWGKDHTTQPHVKKRIETSTEYLRTLIYEDNRGTTKTLSDIFNGVKVFDNPKPYTVLSRIIDFASFKSATILDFFAGSGTTLHAVMQLNAEDGGNRKCILAQSNENGICENVTYERNKRVINGYTKPNGEAVEGLHANNLRYYRMAFVGRDRSPQNLRRLMALATDMLCIKEDLYTEVKEFAGQKTHPSVFRYFERGSKRMVVIYLESAVPAIVKLIKRFELPKGEKIKVYVFSPSEDPWAGEFETVEGQVTLCALPMAILNVYKRILPKRHDRNIFVNPEEDSVGGPENESGGSFAAKGGDQ